MTGLQEGHHHQRENLVQNQAKHLLSLRLQAGPQEHRKLVQHAQSPELNTPGQNVVLHPLHQEVQAEAVVLRVLGEILPAEVVVVRAADLAGNLFTHTLRHHETEIYTSDWHSIAG